MECKSAACFVLVVGPSILVPASELAFSKATGGTDEASTLLRAEPVNDFETVIFSI